MLCVLGTGGRAETAKPHLSGPSVASSITSIPFGAECTLIKEVKEPVH